MTVVYKYLARNFRKIRKSFKTFSEQEHLSFQREQKRPQV